MSDQDRKPRVLIADDDPQGAELLEAYLGECDYDVDMAADGEVAFRKIQGWLPDVILLDIMMPKIGHPQQCRPDDHGPRSAQRHCPGR
jgi:CheY-like chemotaxis protein